MSIHDKETFRTIFTDHYNNLKPVLYIWDKNSEYHEYEDKTTYKKEFVIDSDEPYEFKISDNENKVCNHNHNNTRQCEPDLVKCPIEHMLIVHSTVTDDTHTVFDFQPMSVRATEDDEHGRKILKYRAEYGVFDADYQSDKKYKQEKMKQIDVYHPRYHLETILGELNNNIDEYRFPFKDNTYNGQDMEDDNKRYNHEETIRLMGRRYIFLSVDYLEKHPNANVSGYITDREREMMVHFYGIPGSEYMADPTTWGDPRVCSMEEGKGREYWARTKDWSPGVSKNNETTRNGSLFSCINEDKTGNSAFENKCNSKNDTTGPFDRCRRCNSNCGSNYISRPCARNVWYSNFDNEKEYRPQNYIVNDEQNKLCPFDGFGTEIPDDVNDPENVCWKGDYLLKNWDSTCKGEEYAYFKRNYCAGSPEDDLKMHKPEDYKNARYLTDDKCNGTSIKSEDLTKDMAKLCEWVANVEHEGNINGHPVHVYCGCHKKTFLDQGKETYFLNLTGNQNKLETIKEWSNNSVLNDVIYDSDTQTYGISSTNKGILEQIEPMCWPSCVDLKSYPQNANLFGKFLTDYQKQSCTLNACINMIEANNNNNLGLQDVTQSCTYTSRLDETETNDSSSSGGNNNNSGSSGGNNNSGSSGGSSNSGSSGNNNNSGSDSSDGSNESPSPNPESDEEDTFFGFTAIQWTFIGLFVVLICIIFSAMAASMLLL